MHVDSESSERWYALRTQPRREAIAEISLLRQNFLAYLPKTIVTKRHARKFETVKAALFPRYAFVRLDTGRDRWRSINGTTGVEALVMAGDRPLAVPSGVVESLISASDADGVVDVARGMRPGDPVRLVSGPFSGAVGTLLSLDAKGRVEMLLDLLTGAVRLKVAREMLEAVG
jgi:transcription elongation factor/antiterminator RfaH